MNFEELQKMQYEVCKMMKNSKDEKTEECIFDVFWSLSNLIRLCL